jgi:hypothetical protein
VPSLPAGYARHEQLYRSFYEDPAAAAYHARTFGSGGASIVFQPSAAHQHHLHQQQQQQQQQMHAVAAAAAEPSPVSSTSDTESVVAVQHAERA